jgi:hypothetical protein
LEKDEERGDEAAVGEEVWLPVESVNLETNFGSSRFLLREGAIGGKDLSTLCVVISSPEVLFTTSFGVCWEFGRDSTLTVGSDPTRPFGAIEGRDV